MSAIYEPQYFGRSKHKPTVEDRAVDWVSGEFPSAKNNRLVRYEGLLSRNFIVLLEADVMVVSYEEKPSTFEWSDGLRWKTFKPTFAVVLADDRSIAVRVMPLVRAKRFGIVRNIQAIRTAAIDAGYGGFELWTEREIERQPALANANLLASERSFVTSPDDLHRVRVAIREIGGRATVRELRRVSGLGDRSFRTIVRLVANGELHLSNNEVPLDDHAVVQLPA